MVSKINVPILINMDGLKEIQTAMNEMIDGCEAMNSINEKKQQKLKDLLGEETAKQAIEILFGELDV